MQKSSLIDRFLIRTNDNLEVAYFLEGHSSIQEAIVHNDPS